MNKYTGIRRDSGLGLGDFRSGSVAQLGSRWANCTKNIQVFSFFCPLNIWTNYTKNLKRLIIFGKDL